ncbi:MAG: WXG100 family type VII secretion target [Nocardioides sp.]
MSNVNVTYDEISRVASQIDAGRDQLMQQMELLSREVDGLVSSGFVTDAASGAYLEQFTTYSASTQKAIEALTGFAETLRHTATAFQETDAQLSSAIRGQG